MTGSEIVKVEESQTAQFVALGLGRYEAIKAVEAGIDWHAVEALIRSGCSPSAALESAR